LLESEYNCSYILGAPGTAPPRSLIRGLNERNRNNGVQVGNGFHDPGFTTPPMAAPGPPLPPPPPPPQAFVHISPNTSPLPPPAGDFFPVPLNHTTFYPSPVSFDRFSGNSGGGFAHGNGSGSSSFPHGHAAAGAPMGPTTAVFNQLMEQQLANAMYNLNIDPTYCG